MGCGWNDARYRLNRSLGLRQRVHVANRRLDRVDDRDCSSVLCSTKSALFAQSPLRSLLIRRRTQSDGFFSNYFNRNSFSDASSAALMAAVSYRLAQLNLGSSTLAAAQRTRLAIYSSLSPTTAILTPVVNPLSYSNEGTYSPEGQAFMLLMEAAWRDWVLAGSKESDTKASGVTVAKSRGRRGEVQGWASLVGLALGGWLLF